MANCWCRSRSWDFAQPNYRPVVKSSGFFSKNKFVRDTDQYVQRLLRAGYIGIRLKFFGDMKLPASCVRFGGAFVVTVMTIVIMTEAVRGALVTSSPLSQSQLRAPPASTPRFEVASIKPAAPDARPGRVEYAANGASINTNPGLLSIRSISLKDLIAAAYSIEAYQVSGGLAWVDSDQLEVTARSSSPASREQLLLMLRPLLSDRFRLEFHSATKEIPAYALTVGQSGKLQRMKSSEESKPNPFGPDMPTFARFLTRFGADMPVIDKTGLTGQFKFDLDMRKIVEVATDISGTPPSNEGMYRGTVEFIDRQWGLKLIPTKAPIEVLVIDRVNRPSAN